jgi:hypothetical protein
METASIKQMTGEERTREMAGVGEGSALEGCVMALRARARIAQSADCHGTMLPSRQALVGRAVALVNVPLANVVLATSVRRLARPEVVRLNTKL